MLAAGRLKPGISIQQAQQEINAVAAEFAKEHPAAEPQVARAIGCAERL